MADIQLRQPSSFQLVSGLWKGERAPLQRARVLRSTNFRGDGLVNFSDVIELEVETRKFEERRLQPGDIIVERSGGGPKQPVGRVALFEPPDNQPYFTSNFTTALRIVNRSQFDPRYVALYLHGLYLSGATETLQRAPTGIRNLDWNEYLNFEIPELPMQEQIHIVDLISSVRTVYRNEEMLLDVMREVKRSAMLKLFTQGLRGEPQVETEIGFMPETWAMSSVGSVREFLQYGTSTRCTVEPQPYPVLRIPNIEPARVNNTDLKYCALPSEEASKYMLVDGDLIFIRTNGVLDRLGSCAVYTGEPERALFASYLIRARLKQGVNPRYVAYFYGSERGTSLVAGRATPAADGKYNLNTGTIDSLPLPLPPTLEEQGEIVAILDAIGRKIDLHKQKRTVLEHLFKALLHKLMTGEIRVNELDLSAISQTREGVTA